MADDTLDIVEPFDYHPCDSPRGMPSYDLNILTSEQQVELNQVKINVARENEKYLAKHPEIRALIAMISRHVFLHRPRTNLHKFIGDFFSRPKNDIVEEMEAYLEERKDHVYECDSAVIVEEDSIRGEDSDDQVYLDTVSSQKLDEVVYETFKRLCWEVDISQNPDQQRSLDAPPGEALVKNTISKFVSKIIDDGRNDIIRYLLNPREGNDKLAASVSEYLVSSFFSSEQECGRHEYDEEISIKMGQPNKKRNRRKGSKPKKFKNRNKFGM